MKVLTKVQERWPKDFHKSWGGLSGISEIPGISRISGVSSGFRGGKLTLFLRFQAVIVCKRFKNARFSGKNFLDFPEFPEISGNFPKVSKSSPRFRGENLGVFSGFPAVIACRHHQNGFFSGDAFRDFPKFPEISGNFPKMPGISPGFWGENSGVFSWFQAVIPCKSL